MKSKKILLSLSLAIVVAMAFVLPVASLRGTTDVAYAAADNYYSSITATSGTALLGQLHDLIVTSRTKYSSYADCKSYATDTDPGSASNTVMDFYTQADISVSKFDVSGGWNREHVWPKANSNGLWKSQTVGGGADLHHIRPSEKDINNDRGNLKYGEASNKSPMYATGISGIIGGYSSGGIFEPTDNVKGDVARICMYVYTHYNTFSNVSGTTNGNGDKAYFGTLKFTDNISASSEDAAIKLLLKWNKLDPVDDIERNRNEAVYAIQHNRNPFIDNEKYADAIWGGTPLQGGNDNPPQGDGTNLSKFTADVSAISSATILQQRFDAIKTALSTYKLLTETERTDSAAQAAYKTLQDAIAAYNADVAKQNAVMENATKTGAYAIVGVTLAVCALIAVLERKFN